MKQYHVTGMSCAACSARVEKAVSAVPGVTACSVSLLTNSMGVEGSASQEEIIKAVINAGYGASPKSGSGSPETSSSSTADLEDTETPKMKKRLLASLALLLPLMYVSMGNMLWNWPLPAFMDHNHLAVGLFELLLSGLIMVINQKFFINGFKGLLHKAPNMDTLVAMGASAAFGYSVYALFAMTVAVSSGDHANAMKFMDEFYFESAATILTLITVGKTLEARSKGRTTNALKSLMKLAPKVALVLRDGVETEIPVSQVLVGDRFIVKSGMNIPVDGIVLEGSGSVNEAALTGESIPVDKQVGSSVSAATMNQTGYMICEATRVGEDTTLSQIIRMVSDAAATKAPIAKLADKVSGIFVPAVISIAMLTLIIWLILGKGTGYALARAISVLVISCPCALGLATPVAIMVGNGVGASHGILFKTAASLEESGRINIIALDKTGTITEGRPVVRKIIPSETTSEAELLSKAFALEAKSEHPLAKAIVELGHDKGLIPDSITDLSVSAGHGLSATLEGKPLAGGNLAFISRFVSVNDETVAQATALSEEGLTPLFFSFDHQFLGIIAVADRIRSDSAAAVSMLRKLGIHVIMLTGDNEKTAQAIGREAGVDEVISGVLPGEKKQVIDHLRQKGKVAMVGDGINDAPALTAADIGIAIGAGADVALDAADVVLVKSNLSDVASTIRLSRATLRNIKENLFWAFCYNALGIPLAAGLFISLFGWTLNPMFGAAAMGLSSFCVVSNALRLNFMDPTNASKDHPGSKALGSDPLLREYIQRKEEKKNMEIKVNGMMCGHCEAHVKKALEKIEGVVEATPDHNTGVVAIKAEKEIDMAVVKAAIEDAGYEFVG